MKHLFLVVATCVFTLAAFAKSPTSPTIATDKPGYRPGQTITLHGERWAAGEKVLIVIKDATEAGGEQMTVSAVADENGTFTAAVLLPEENEAQERGREGHRRDASAKKTRYTVSASGVTSRGTTTDFEEEAPIPDGAGLIDAESYWAHRISYPTGEFDPQWVRNAATEDAKIERRVPAGAGGGDDGGGRFRAKSLSFAASPLALSTSSFTALGPKPLRMTGCSGCFDYTTTSGRINSIAIDPTTTTNGSIVAYAASVGGGVWKTTNCCSSSTAWTVMTDLVVTSTTSIDNVTIDPQNHNTIYAGTGDLNYGSFSMGSQGILKSTDGGLTWTVLGANVFGPALPEPAGQFPQYQAVGKVRVDPNNSNNVVAGTKTGLYFSYDGGANWTGPCTTNTFSTMRQDITALELTNMGGGVTRIIAAVGVRGFATTVQFNLGENGANGIYRGTMQASGCPSFTSIAGNSNGFVLPTSVLAASNLNAGSGDKYVSAGVGNQLGRIDIGIAPSDPNVMYAQVQSITPNNNSGGSSGGCANANGCQLGAWSSIDGGATWTFMANSNGNALRTCNATGPGTSTQTGDYPQNWYDQGVVVDPNNPDRVFFDTYEVWLVTRTGTSWYNTTCGYAGNNPHPVHVDQHALAFVPGSSSILLAGNDGGVHGTTNADAATLNTARPSWFNMDTGFNTIEFYSGDISGNFVTSGAPQASGGAQDNGSMSITFAGGPSGPVQWQMGVGGDGFYSRIDPVGTGTSLRMWQGNNSGGLSRCTNNCTASGAAWSSRRGAWTGDTQSFILPYDLFHGGIPGGDDCEAAGASTGCGHLIAGTTRVWETIAGASTGANVWVVTNNPTTQNMTKQTLGNRSFINQVKYSPKKQSVAIVGTNDANVWIGFNLGTGVQAQANWVNVTGGNSVLPNRPVLGIALDPSTTDAPVGYAGVGGFNANTPTQPGHVFRVVCATNCASFTWQNKSGNLPDVPVDSIIANPNFPAQVFAGTDFGLYYTDDVTANPPVWFRFTNGLPNVMIWDMQIDRGATALSLWTRSRGAYVWPLAQGPLTPLPTVLSTIAASGTYGGTVHLSATFSSGGNPVAGKSIDFTLNGNAVGSAPTDASGVATLTGASLASINAGTYPAGVRARFAGDSVYATSNATASLFVDHASVTPHITASDKEYDGTVAATLTSRTLTGVIGTDDVGLAVATATFADKNAGNNKTVTGTGLSLTGTTAPNYVLDSPTVTTTASITQAPLTIAANNASRLYSYPNPPFSATYTGFKNGETLTTSDVTGTPSLTTAATQTSAAGQYPIVAAMGSLASNNYSLHFINGTLTIYLSGFVGVDSASIGASKALADSFNGTAGYPASQGNNVLILSNGLVDVKGARINGNILSAQGSVQLGPGSFVTGDVSAGTTITNQGTIGGSATPNHGSGGIVAPAVAPCGAFTPAGNWISGNYSYANGDLTVNANGTATISAGTYCFHNVKLSGQGVLQTNGAVSIGLTGTLQATGGSLVNASHVASNLQFASSFSGDDGVLISGGADAYLTVYAPRTSVAVSGGSPVFGALLGKTLTISGNSQIHYDTTLPSVWGTFFGF